MAEHPSTSDTPARTGASDLVLGAATTAVGLARWTFRTATRTAATVFPPAARLASATAERAQANADLVLRQTIVRVLGVALAAVDLTALVREHIDLDAVAADLDVDAVVERVDTAAIANRLLDEIDLPEIVRESSDIFTSEAVSGVRTRAIRADSAVTRGVARVLRRPAPPPTGAVGNLPAEVAHYRPAGVVSRLLGAVLDAAAVAALTFLLYFCVAGLRFVVWPASFHWPQPSVLLSLVVSVSVAIVYLTTGWVTTGRSVGGSVLGYRVLSRDRELLDWPRATARAALYVLFPVGLAFAAIGPTRRSLQDKLLRTNVVYDWHHDGGRAASTAAG
ncbi:RDD family protein [Actinophytocola sp.]|uniref:RDD family protein n=1 Tax=Actinophytocola sp. TaxID=1872138 RepID=UPI00389AA67B